MSSHHDHDNHSHEAKPVAFRTPLILGLVTILVILLAVSTCDNKHHGSCECKEDCSEECMKKCESGDHSGHMSEGHGEAAATTTLEAVETDEHTAVADTTVKADTTAHVATPVKAEEEHAPAHH
jgi:hypothetical protein